MNSIPVRPRIDIDSLVETKLLSAPGSLIRINNLLKDYSASVKSITEAFSYEPALVTKILRLANSALFSLETEVISISAAINTIGTKHLQELVMIQLASITFGKQIHNSPIGKKIWEHSLAVAIFARELSNMLEMQGIDENFTCGLLHDLGKLILLSHNFEDYIMVLEKNEESESELLISESRQYGYNHAEIGSLVARRWGLPDAVCYVILNHHNPSQSQQHPMLATHIIDIADIMANSKGYGSRTIHQSQIENSESVMKLGFTPEVLERAWNKTEGNIQEVIKTFI